MNYYAEHDKHLVAVDCIVFGFDNDKLKILLIKRRMEPYKDNWSLMGGFVKSNESVDDAAKRISFNLTGLTDVYLEQLSVFGETNREPGERVISVTYYALIKLNESDVEIAKANGASWFTINEHPRLILDHEQMVSTALQKLRRKCRTQPLGFELLPEKFTIPQLQSLYEAILMQPLDKRNFRKKILAMNLLDKLEEKEKTSSKKGAFLYKFDDEKYRNLSQQGFTFEV